MASNDPIAAILDQLAAHREQLARLSRTLDEHAAALAELTATTIDTADPDGYQPEPAPQWWNLPADPRAQPIARLPRAWRNPVYRRARHLSQAPRELAPAPRWSEPVIPRHLPGGLTSGNFLWN